MTRQALILLASCAVGALSTGTAAVAQTAPAANSRPVAVEEVIVTADRRERKLQDVPSAISAITEQALERSRIVDLSSLSTTVPSFSMTESSALGKELSIRGVTSVRILDATAEPSVGMFVDEVYLSRMGSAFTDFYDLERVEVIRGPQGVLLGKNVVGGAISVITAKPKFDPSGATTISFGNYDSVMANGYVTGALTDDLAGRVAFQVRNRSGYSKNVVLGGDMDNLKSYQGRGGLLYRAPDADLQVLATFDYGSDETDGTARVMTDDPFAAGTGAVAAWRAARGLGPRDATRPQHEYSRRITRGAMLRVDWGVFEGAKLTSITGYRSSKGDKSGTRLAQCLEDGGDGLCVAALVLAKGQSFTVNYGKDWNALTPQGIIEYRPNDNVMIYGSVAKGFKGGGWDHLPSTAAAAAIGYDPEKATNYEIGVKSDLFDRRVRLNLAAFKMDYKDLQSQQLVLECLCLITSNAGTAEIKGLEAEGTWAVSEDLTLTASGSWLDAKYKNFVDGAGVVFSGNRIQRSPEYKFDIGANYVFGIGEWDQAFSLQTNYTKQGKSYWTPANTFAQEPFGLWDASLRVQPPGAAWSVTVWGKNLTDELYAVAAQTFFGDLMNYYAPPKTYGVDLKYEF